VVLVGACLEIRLLSFRTVEFRDLEILGRDRVEVWVVLPARSLILGRRWYHEGPQIRSNDGTLSARHARIVPDRGGFAVHDMMSSGGTFINRGRLKASQPPHRLAQGDVIYLGAPVGGTAMTFHAAAPAFTCAPVERELAAAVRAGVEGSRLVYADWLEQRGDEARAAFLRDRDALAQLPPATQLFDAQLGRCVDALATVDAGWRLHLLAG
jgi:uncharacterized protein (TIGR02996 family)